MKQPKQATRISPPAPERLPAVIESLLFVADEPLEIATLAKSVGVSRDKVEKAVAMLAESVEGRGVIVQRIGDRIQLATSPDAAPYLEQFLEVEHGHLSRASLEALAIIAYRQPVTRVAIEAVRGVNSDHAVATLVARGLIEEVGRAQGPGRPVLFGTTVRFLEYFGLRDPRDLPPLPELEAFELPPIVLEEDGASETADGAEAEREASGAADA